MSTALFERFEIAALLRYGVLKKKNFIKSSRDVWLRSGVLKHPLF